MLDLIQEQISAKFTNNLIFEINSYGVLCLYQVSASIEKFENLNYNYKLSYYN